MLKWDEEKRELDGEGKCNSEEWRKWIQGGGRDEIEEVIQLEEEMKEEEEEEEDNNNEEKYKEEEEE